MTRSEAHDILQEEGVASWETREKILDQAAYQGRFVMRLPGHSGVIIESTGDDEFILEVY